MKTCGSCKYFKKNNYIYSFSSDNEPDYICTQDNIDHESYNADFYNEACRFYEPRYKQEKYCHYCLEDKIMLLEIKAIKYTDRCETIKLQLKPKFCPNCGRKIM